jgi:hypothetical protein
LAAIAEGVGGRRAIANLPKPPKLEIGSDWSLIFALDVNLPLGSTAQRDHADYSNSLTRFSLCSAGDESSQYLLLLPLASTGITKSLGERVVIYL